MRILKSAFLYTCLAVFCIAYAQDASNPDDETGGGGGQQSTDLTVTVSNVKAIPQWPWNGIVDVEFEVTCPGFNPETMAMFVEIQGRDIVTGELYRHLKAVDGDGNVRSAGVGTGVNRVQWDAKQEFGADSAFNSSNFQIGVQAILKDKPVPLTEVGDNYMIVHLEDNGDFSKGDITYSSDGPDLSDDACRTTQLWLRKIPAGTFTMGKPGSTFANTRPHQVTISKDYYIGVFELTHKQWELIMGKPISDTANSDWLKGDLRPASPVSYHDARGRYYGEIWPREGMIANPNHVDPSSFIGVLRSLTGTTFDLPTEAEWEYACRAGTTTDLNDGTNLGDDPEVAMINAGVGRFEGNENDGSGGYDKGTTKVGSYKPNNWGLYDMHGNAMELCLDRYGDYTGYATSDPNIPIVDPNGGYDPTLGDDQDILCVIRGGYYEYGATKCTSWARDHDTQAGSLGNGIRVCWRPIVTGSTAVWIK